MRCSAAAFIRLPDRPDLLVEVDLAPGGADRLAAPRRGEDDNSSARGAVPIAALSRSITLARQRGQCPVVSAGQLTPLRQNGVKAVFPLGRILALTPPSLTFSEG